MANRLSNELDERNVSQDSGSMGHPGRGKDQAMIGRLVIGHRFLQASLRFSKRICRGKSRWNGLTWF